MPLPRGTWTVPARRCDIAGASSPMPARRCFLARRCHLANVQPDGKLRRRYPGNQIIAQTLGQTSVDSRTRRVFVAEGQWLVASLSGGRAALFYSLVLLHAVAALVGFGSIGFAGTYASRAYLPGDAERAIGRSNARGLRTRYGSADEYRGGRTRRRDRGTTALFPTTSPALVGPGGRPVPGPGRPGRQRRTRRPGPGLGARGTLGLVVGRPSSPAAWSCPLCARCVRCCSRRTNWRRHRRAQRWGERLNESASPGRPRWQVRASRSCDVLCTSWRWRS